MVSGGLTRITKMKYKAIIYKTTGVCISNAFPLLRNCTLVITVIQVIACRYKNTLMMSRIRCTSMKHEVRKRHLIRNWPFRFLYYYQTVKAWCNKQVYIKQV